MANQTYTDGRDVKNPSGKLPGPADHMSQRQVYSQTGKVKTPAEAGASGKPSTPKTW